MSNPFLTRGLDEVSTGDRPMTLNGTINRTGVLLVICLCAGDYAWTHGLSGGAILGALLGGFIVAMIGTFKAEWTPVLAPVYALLEGLVLGGIALFYNIKYPGIALNAGLLTAAVLFVLLGLYASRIVKVTDGLVTGIFAATSWTWGCACSESTCLTFTKRAGLASASAWSRPGLRRPICWLISV